MSNDPADVASNPRPLRIFLCHSSVDKLAVREVLYRRLKADGFEPWLDEQDLLPGQDWQLEIPKAVRQSDMVIVCLSKASINAADYLQLKFALDVADEQPAGDIFIIPLRLEECNIPDRLQRWQGVDLFDTNGYARLLLAVQFRAKSLLAASATPSEELAAPRPQTDETSQSDSVVSNQSGGVDLKTNDAAVGEDVIGRDKVVSAGGHIIHAEPGSTIVFNTPSVSEPVERIADEKAGQEQPAPEKTEAEQLAAPQAETERSANEKAAPELLVAAQKAEAERIVTQSSVRNSLVAENSDVLVDSP